MNYVQRSVIHIHCIKRKYKNTTRLETKNDRKSDRLKLSFLHNPEAGRNSLLIIAIMAADMQSV